MNRSLAIMCLACISSGISAMFFAWLLDDLALGKSAGHNAFSGVFFACLTIWLIIGAVIKSREER